MSKNRKNNHRVSLAQAQWTTGLYNTRTYTSAHIPRHWISTALLNGCDVTEWDLQGMKELVQMIYQHERRPIYIYVADSSYIYESRQILHPFAKTTPRSWLVQPGIRGRYSVWFRAKMPSYTEPSPRTPRQILFLYYYIFKWELLKYNSCIKLKA